MFIFYYKISFYDEIEEGTATVAGMVNKIYLNVSWNMLIKMIVI